MCVYVCGRERVWIGVSGSVGKMWGMWVSARALGCSARGQVEEIRTDMGLENMESETLCWTRGSVWVLWVLEGLLGVR